MRGFKGIILSITLGILLIWTVIVLITQAMPAASPSTVNTGQHFLPPYGNARDRFGFDHGGALAGYDVAQLQAGWYSNWGAAISPEHPDGLVYVQLVRFEAGTDPTDPAGVSVSPDKARLAQIIAAHPGSLWLLANEPDSLYQGTPLLPEVYAVVYHDVYAYIKGLDPTALIANGGIVQPTPCRMEYLDIVWDTYLATFEEPWPVDVWNIHAFLLREVFGSWGASTPPGVDPACGMDYAVDQADDLVIFWDNIKAMRTWMKDKGYQDRPLIISEYGILWPTWFAPQFTPARVSHFMTQTFDLFLNHSDTDSGYPADGHRLVQAWAWYSLSEDQVYNGFLFNSDTQALSPMGQAYAAYTTALSDTDYVDLSSRLVIQNQSPPTLTLSLVGEISNLGRRTANGVLVQLTMISDTSGTVTLGQDTVFTVPGRFQGMIQLAPLTLTLAAPAYYEFSLRVDPSLQITEAREWNNVATATVDARPDLAVLAVDYRLDVNPAQSGTLELTATIHNQGSWSSPAVSGTAFLQPIAGGTVGVPALFPIPPLDIGEQVRVPATLDWPVPEHDLYYLVILVDELNSLWEQNRANNVYKILVPVTLTTTLMPSTTTVLTNASGSLQWVFMPGTVTTPTQVQLSPLWPADWESGSINKGDTAFSLAAMVNGQPVSGSFRQPVSVTWWYQDAEIAQLDEPQLRLFVLAGEGFWRDAGCRPYRREPGLNRLDTALSGTGRFLFGNRYDFYLPLAFPEGALRSNGVPGTIAPDQAGSDRQTSSDVLDGTEPGSPLRLPQP